MSASTKSRFKDVLIALSACSETNYEIRRIQLQKFIYLQDIFCGIWRVVEKPARFQSYLRGPYDRNIQDAVDALAFRGLVDVSAVHFAQLNQIYSNYRLTPAGHEAVRTLCANPVLEEERALAAEIAIEVDRRGWHKIVEIVYSEPTYYSARERDDRRILPTNAPKLNQTELLAELFRTSWARISDSPPTRESFVQVLFLVLDEFQSPSDARQNNHDAAIADPL